MLHVRSRLALEGSLVGYILVMRSPTIVQPMIIANQDRWFGKLVTVRCHCFLTTKNWAFAVEHGICRFLCAGGVYVEWRLLNFRKVCSMFLDNLKKNLYHRGCI